MNEVMFSVLAKMRWFVTAMCMKDSAILGEYGSSVGLSFIKRID